MVVLVLIYAGIELYQEKQPIASGCNIKKRTTHKLYKKNFEHTE